MDEREERVLLSNLRNDGGISRGCFAGKELIPSRKCYRFRDVFVMIRYKSCYTILYQVFI